MKRSFTMFPHLMTVVGSYMHPVGQAAGRPICWIEHASRHLPFALDFAFAFGFDGFSSIFLCKLQCNGQGFVF